MKFTLLLCILLLAASNVQARGNLDFTLRKLESGVPGPTLLVVGGIQGDEPGGYNAASLLVSNFRITKGAVWVVPNLNFASIISNSRGVHGDLNRKFSKLKSTDPEYGTIQKIKSIITDKKVDIILNLHDGSGYYRPKYIDELNNPRRWGQSVIIDQERVNVQRYGDLGNIARRVVSDINHHLFEKKHVYHVKNTKTRLGDVEMEKTLTYFAINNGKAAFGIEASKSFSTNVRAYYHLHALEAFMDCLGITYERNFELTAKGVKDVIDSNLAVALNDTRVLLRLDNVRPTLSYVPVKKGALVEFETSNSLLTIVRAASDYHVFYGNRLITRIKPQFFKYDTGVKGLEMRIDGTPRKVNFGRVVKVKNLFEILPKKGCRVNVIGYTKPEVENEVNLPISRGEIQERFSLDKGGWVYRVEVYKGDTFAGMVLVDFDTRPKHYYTSRPLGISHVALDRRVIFPSKIAQKKFSGSASK